MYLSWRLVTDQPKSAQQYQAILFTIFKHSFPLQSDQNNQFVKDFILTENMYIFLNNKSFFYLQLGTLCSYDDLNLERFVVGLFCSLRHFITETFLQLGPCAVGTFCSLGRFVLGVFCSWDVLYSGRFVSGRFVAGTFVLGRFVSVP